MRIGIDISPLGSAHNTRGTGSYTRLLVEALYTYFPLHTIVSFHSSEGLPEDVDLYHFPYFDPFFLTLPAVRLKPTVVTVHDLIPLAYPDQFPRGFRGYVKWFIQKSRLRSVQAVITDSISSKKDIVVYGKCRDSAVHVIPLAASSEFVRVSDESLLDGVRRKYTLPGKFFLYVGDINWNKNIPGLVRGYAYARNKSHKNFPELLLVGKAFTHTHIPELALIHKAITESGVESNVRMIGFVDSKDLPSIYTLADAYAQVSFAEGFGLPVLEAMACGCPTVVSGTSSLAEIAGPSVTVDPDSHVSIAEGLLRMVKSIDTRKRRTFVDWSGRYSWKKTAEETVRIYHSLIQ